MTLLEDDVADLQDEVEEVETSNTLQDERLNTVEEAVIQNVNEIDGETHYYFSKRIIEELLGNIKQIFMKTETHLLHFSCFLQSASCGGKLSLYQCEVSAHALCNLKINCSLGFQGLKNERPKYLVNYFPDLGDSVDDTQNSIIVLQQQIAELQETNTLLLERIDELETDAEISQQQIARVTKYNQHYKPRNLRI